MKKIKNKSPKILVLDIETSPLIAHVWGLWENNVALNQIQQDWHIMSFAAKWLGDSPKKTVYRDQRKAKDMSNDKEILKVLWEMMDEADIICGQNVKSFDNKKINARFILNGLKPPSGYRVIDTMLIAKSKFAFTSNKLEYMTDKLNLKYKKLKHNKFPGHVMWTECLKGNVAAWNEMKRYNIHDVLATEELYTKLAAWDTTINMNVYHDGHHNNCSACDSSNLKRWGYRYTNTGKFQRYVCGDCGAESKGTENLFTKEKKKALKG